MNAIEIINEANSIHEPNIGIEAITDKDYCIMDELCEHYPYKCEGGCPDFNRCSDSTFMLACLATRNPEQIASWVIETYNNAMKR